MSKVTSSVIRSMTSRRTWARGALSSAAALALSSCGDGTCHDCFFYGPGASSVYSNEVSSGLVAGNFANNSFNSIVTTSEINNGLQPNPGTLNTYIASGPLAYAAPVVT